MSRTFQNLPTDPIPANCGIRMSERIGEEAYCGCPAREFYAGLAARVIAFEGTGHDLRYTVCISLSRLVNAFFLKH